MNFLLFSGPAGAGKTPSVTRYKDYLVTTGYSVQNFTASNGGDFSCVLVKKNRKIIVWSASDTPKIIDGLVNMINLNPDAEAVITSCKSFDVWPRQYQFGELKLKNASNYFFEIPLGRQVTGGGRRQSLGWYLASVLRIAIIVGNQSPFNF